jgi:UDP-N-acetyl-2-amino-2-deoxyglucuronate dehydrogenase
MFSAVNGRKIRTAIVGCGRISKNHFGSIATHADSIELVSVCDIDQQTLEGATTELGVKGYHRLEDMQQQEQLDLVALCTPSGLHSMQAQTMAKYKVNVMTEKPMATRWNDGVNMVKACDDAGVRLFVVKQYRSNATL